MDQKLFKSILMIITYAVLLVLAILKFDTLLGWFSTVLSLLRPLFIGFAIAFVLNRPCDFFQSLYARGLKGGRREGLARPLAVLSSYLALVLFFGAVFSFVLPKLVESLTLFANSLGTYITNLQTWVNEILARLNLEMLDLSDLKNMLNQLFSGLLGFFSNLTPHILDLTTNLISIVVTTVLSLVFSAYMLSGKEKLLPQCRRILRAYVPRPAADYISSVTALTAGTFTKFVSGQLIEACILGGLCAIGMLFIQADYAPLIGVVIGVSALVPVAGAYIGAVLSALLLLMVSPLKAATFLIFLVILQQFEGNVIYPRVVGTSIGLPGIWVLTAVTVGGGLFGLVGILLSVPVCSVLYTLFQRNLRRRLDASS